MQSLILLNKIHTPQEHHVNHRETGSPFSRRDLSLGAGGTLPIHDLIFCPPTDTVQTPHSPFLQSVGTLNPSFWHAANNEEPGSASILFPFATNGVLPEAVGVASSLIPLAVLAHGRKERVNVLPDENV